MMKHSTDGDPPSNETLDDPAEDNDPCGSCKQPCLPQDNAMTCDGCKIWYHIDCEKVDKKLYNYYGKNKMHTSGFSWFCPPCRVKLQSINLSDESPFSSSTSDYEMINNQIIKEFKGLKEKINNDMRHVNTQISSITQTLQKLDEKPTFASIVGNSKNSPTDAVQVLAKQVTDTQKKLSTEREAREKNVIIYNVPEVENTSDQSFFSSMCSKKLELPEAPEVEMTRLPMIKAAHPKPIKVVFKETWEKRKFLSCLYKLKDDKQYEKILVKHDMCKEDRDQNKALLTEAYHKNELEKPKEFRYKVRGPPWNMKIVKLFPKN